MNNLMQNNQDIETKIFTIRGFQVMLDRDLAELYDVETKRLNEQVKRNIKRFPQKFRFQLDKNEKNELVAKCDRFETLKHSTSFPYVFTEQGVSMLSAVLKSDVAIDISIKIMDSFVNMRKFISSNNELFQRLNNIEKRQIGYEIKSDEKFDKLFNALEDKSLKPSQGIFYNGQIFDAYSFISDLIREAKQSITLIDNYVDDSVLTLFSKNQDIDVTIYTNTISKQLKLDLEKYNAQYRAINIKNFKDSHDRFLIIDETQIYHIGASLKDLGKKWFAFSKMDMQNVNIVDKLNKENH